MTPQQVGRYQLKREIERGGMSTVYLAHDPSVDRDVALKLLPREFLHHESFRERFNREVKIIATLEHWAIVPIFDFGEDDGQPFFVMRYMTGGSLANRLNNGPLSVDEAAEILKRIGSALDYAHSKGIVHRDMKPGNILFDQFGQAFLADFGIARLQESGASLTGTAYLGTPAYVSPEQVKSTVEVDGRADIYSLGVILFEVLTGDKPFKAENAAFLALKHVSEPVPSILQANPELPPDIDRIINRAMAKDPDERYSKATDLTSDVTMLAAGQTVGPTDKAHEIQAVPPSGELPAGAISAVAAAAGTQIPSSTPISGPDLGTSLGIGEAAGAFTQRRFPRWLVGLIAVLVVVCLGVTVISIAVAGGGGLFGLISDPTATSTITTTPETTATELPTETPTETATSSPTSTALPSRTPTVTASPTILIPPTLRPTLTPEPTNTPAPTRVPTNTPVPPTATSAPQPPSDGGGGSDDGGSDNGGSPPDDGGGPPPPPPPDDGGGPPPPP